MKLNAKIKIVSLLILLLTGPLLKAQGTEAALAGAAVILAILLIIILLGLIFLVIFLIKRNKIPGIISAIFGLFLFVTGLALSLLIEGNSASEFGFITSFLQRAGMINLAVVFIFLQIFPKKNIEIQEPSSEVDTTENSSGKKIVKVLLLLSGLWFFYDLGLAFNFWKQISAFPSNSDTYFIAMQFLPLLLLIVTWILFNAYHRLGWNLFIFYCLYILTGLVLYILRTSFFSPQNFTEILISIRIFQFLVVLFFSGSLYLLLRPDVRALYSVDKKSSLSTLGICAVLAIVILFLSNFLLAFNN